MIAATRATLKTVEGVRERLLESAGGSVDLSAWLGLSVTMKRLFCR